MRRVIALTAILAATSASAQQVMDGSDKGMDQGTKAALFESLIGKLADPFSSQFIRLTMTPNIPGTICGLINTKNLNGGYIGFQPFRYTIETKQFFAHPDVKCP